MVDGDSMLNSNYSHLFDIHKMQYVGKDKYVNVKDIEMLQGGKYHVVVIATDEAGGCAITTETFTVDTTPPVEGTIGLLGALDMVLTLYDNHATQLTDIYLPSY